MIGKLTQNIKGITKMFSNKTHGVESGKNAGTLLVTVISNGNPQMMPNQGYPPQGYQPQGYPPQGQGYPPQG